MDDVKKFFINKNTIEVRVKSEAEFYKLIILINRQEIYNSLFEPQHLRNELYILLNYGLTEQIIEASYGELWS